MLTPSQMCIGILALGYSFTEYIYATFDSYFMRQLLEIWKYSNAASKV
jgi:hypothetical protein